MLIFAGIAGGLGWYGSRTIEAGTMTDSPEIAEARQEVARTRARLMGTAHQLQDRLSPKMLAQGRLGRRQGERRGPRRRCGRRGQGAAAGGDRRGCRNRHVPRTRAAVRPCRSAGRWRLPRSAKPGRRRKPAAKARRDGDNAMTEQDRPRNSGRQPAPARDRGLCRCARSDRRDAQRSTLVALAGGLAAGALIAALLPRTGAETRAVRPTARPRQGQRQGRPQGGERHRQRQAQRSRDHSGEGRGHAPQPVSGGLRRGSSFRRRGARCGAQKLT